MRRRLQALACLGSLAAMSIPASPAAAQAAHHAQAGQTVLSARAGCRVMVARPFLDSGGTIRARAQRTGCRSRTQLRIRLYHARTGPDRPLRSDSRVVTNGRIATGVRCTTTPRRYYTAAKDHGGKVVTSRTVVLACKRPARTGNRASAEESAVVRLTNQARARHGCRPLVHDPRLHRAAEQHSRDMAARGYFEHTGRDGRSGGDRIRANGFRRTGSWGENIAMGQRSPSEVVRGWLASPGHRRNIMRCSFSHIGVGQYGKHWTQVFAGR